MNSNICKSVYFARFDVYVCASVLLCVVMHNDLTYNNIKL